MHAGGTKRGAFERPRLSWQSSTLRSPVSATPRSAGHEFIGVSVDFRCTNFRSVSFTSSGPTLLRSLRWRTTAAGRAIGGSAS
jgi:hypothetical protein